MPRSKWEGDTLVIDSTSFVDTTWLGRGGLFHSADMHIIEKLTRVIQTLVRRARVPCE